MTKEGEAYLNATKIVSLSLEADVEDLELKQKEIELFISGLGKHQEFEGVMKKASTEFSEKIKWLTNKIFELRDQKLVLGGKITNLFRESYEW